MMRWAAASSSADGRNSKAPYTFCAENTDGALLIEGAVSFAFYAAQNQGSTMACQKSILALCSAQKL
jgi:hypothetical protein